MEYAPSNRALVNKEADIAQKNFAPHLEIIRLFASNFEATLNQLDHLLKIFTRFVEVGLENLKIASYHPLSRLVRFELVKFSFELLQYHIKLGSRSSKYLSELILDGALTWFRQRSTYPFGGNKLKFKSELILLKEVAKFVTGLNNFQLELIDMKAKILLYFMDDEICKFTVWLHSMNPSDTSGTYVNQQIGGQHLKFAYEIDQFWQ